MRDAILITCLIWEVIRDAWNGGVDGGQGTEEAGSFDQAYLPDDGVFAEHGEEDVARSGAGPASEEET